MRSAVFLTLALWFAPLVAQEPIRLRRDHVLGTSLDLVVRGDAKAAEAFLVAVLAEIERLDAVFSNWRKDTPVAALSRGETVREAPAELIEVLDRAMDLRFQTSGAFDVRVGAVADLWRQAHKTGKAPDRAALDAAVAAMHSSGWDFDATKRTVEPKGKLVLALDGIAKGYLIAAAMQKARAACPAVAGALLDIGGDQVAFAAAGSEPWQLGVLDPKRPEDNGRVMLRVPFAGGAAATSGGYARGGKVDGTWRSHIVDPGFGQPATGALQATVMAPDAMTADALATAFCVLPPEESLKVAQRMSGVECLIVDEKGRRHATRGFQDLVAKATETTGGGGDSAFPKGHELAITLALPKMDARRYERPYVAVWVEDSKGAHVATLALWGRNRRWVSELTNWWKADPEARDRVDAIGRASRGPGEYRLAWNGTDDGGAGVAPGEYTVVIEVSREHGGHTTTRQKIVCGDKAATAEFAANKELASASLHYGPREVAR
jgi:thiamine biosynthesis lipoprotein